MAFEFVPAQASEQEELIRFLVMTFRADPALISFRPDVVRWKYFSEHPDWPGPRSYVVKENVKEKNEIVAHGGVWPVRLAGPAGAIRAIHLIDWAASRSAVGAGVFLLRKMATLADVMLTIGGSPDTRAVLPKLGYRNCGELRQYARVIRPWMQFRTTPEKNWKTPLKWLRNSVRAISGIGQVPAGWEASKVAAFEGEPDSLTGITPNILSPRTSASLNYLLNCPAATFAAYTVSQSQRLCGYFLIARIGRQARVIDLCVKSESQEAWNATCLLAAHTAAGDPEICEVVAASSIGPVQDAWLRAGFVERRREPIYCYDPRKVLPPGVPLDLNLIDGDQCFMTDPRSPYLL